MILHGIGDEIDSRLSGSDNLSSPHIDSLIIISFLPARYMTLHVKCDEIDSGRHAWWDRDQIYTVHVVWIVGRVSGTCQRVISIVKTPTSCQRKTCINNSLHLARKNIQIICSWTYKYLHTCLFKFINTTKYLNLKRESRV